MMPATFEPKSTSGRRESRNAVAKITPAKKIGTNTSAHDASTFAIPGRFRKQLIGTRLLANSAIPNSA